MQAQAQAAMRLWRKLGSEAIAAADGFVEGCRHSGDETAALFWAGVLRQLQTMAHGQGVASDEASPVNGGRAAATSKTWRYMQMIERCRHRAMQAARAAGAEATRAEMVEIATHWLELASEAEMLANEVGSPNAGATAVFARANG